MIELHVHLDGSLRPSTIWDLAKKAEGKEPCGNLAQMITLMEAPVPCGSLSEYLSCFDLPLMYLQNGEALERVSFELVEDLAKEGINYAEIRFAPQLLVAGGLSQTEASEAVEAGVKRGMQAYPSIKTGLLLCCMRGAGDEIHRKNMETIEIANDRVKEGIVCGVDLAGAEEVYDTGFFLDIFREAARLGLKKTIHAGEAAGPESIWKALDMGALRIGHGIAAIKDESLVKELVKRQTVLEICVTSNLQTKGVSSLLEHPIKKLYDAGVHVTVNTDNRTVSHTTLAKEIALVKNTFKFTEADVSQMEQYAVEGAFLFL